MKILGMEKVENKMIALVSKIFSDKNRNGCQKMHNLMVSIKPLKKPQK